MIVGNDEKIWWDEGGKAINQAPGKTKVGPRMKLSGHPASLRVAPK